jgi:hypothetical protein
LIPRSALTAWCGTLPWPTVEQIEQDLLLSRVIVEVANDDYPRDKMKRSAFREDIRPWVTVWPEGYDIDAAAELVIADVLALIE